MFARFDENPAMTLQDIKETKRYGLTDARTHGRTDGQRENSLPTTTKFAGGIIIDIEIGSLKLGFKGLFNSSFKTKYLRYKANFVFSNVK